MSTPEGKIQLAVIKYLKKEGILCWRNNSMGVYDKKFGGYRTNPYAMKGVGDILGCVNSVFVSWEIKAKSKQSADQKLFQQRLERHGGKYYLIHSVEEAKASLVDLGIT